MFRKSYNRCVLQIKVKTETPLLIRSGDTGLSPTAANLSCVRTRHGRRGRTVYIPGSSLKGVVRQSAEASVRGKTFSGVAGACDPLDNQASCWSRVRTAKQDPKAKMNSPEVCTALCLACRTFGSLAAKGRTSVRDLFPWRDSGEEAVENRTNFERANQVELRQGVAINRITGAAQKGALFEQEVVPAGVEFWGEIAMENYQLWQLGLVAQALDELDSGFARLGSSTSRGLGQIRASLVAILHEQPMNRFKEPAGVGALVTEQEIRDYNLFAEDSIELPIEAIPYGLFERFEVTDPGLVEKWRGIALSRLGALQ